MSWQTVIGLEVHVQLKTKSKLFSSSPTRFGASPNTQTNFVDAGLPGVLPVLNQEAVNMAIMFGLAINGNINNYSFFERKNYFYPDLPKGYQISQFQKPIISQGHINTQINDGTTIEVEIDRAHLEEDAGKSIHDIYPEQSAIDLNRAGTPLLEIVTTPCMYSAEHAIGYLKKLHQLVKFLGICDGNLQEGSFRCDVNLSVNRKDDKQLGVRTEIKNLNSFRYIEKAINYEAERHIDALENNELITQETRLYAPNKNATISMRSKESDNDYRYFPDPDLLPIEITTSQLKNIKDNMPRLPDDIRVELSSAHLNEDDIDFILNAPEIYAYFKSVQTCTKASAQLIINWLKGPISATLNDAQSDFKKPPINHETLSELLNLIFDNKLNSNQAKTVYDELLSCSQPIADIIREHGFDETLDTTLLEKLINDIIQGHPKQAQEYLSGKDKLLGFFVGQVMKQTKGKANPAEINKLIIDALNNKKAG